VKISYRCQQLTSILIDDMDGCDKIEAEASLVSGKADVLSAASLCIVNLGSIAFAT